MVPKFWFPQKLAEELFISFATGSFFLEPEDIRERGTGAIWSFGK
jgi:hypothetical protein